MDYSDWLIVLLVTQACLVMAWAIYDTRTPTPVDQLMRDRYFGGV